MTTAGIAPEQNRSRKLLLLAAAWMAVAAPIAVSQPPAGPAPPAAAAPLSAAPAKPIDFDIATFRLNKSGGNDHKLAVSADGFTMQNRPFHDLIRYAFAKGRGGAYRISDQPDWVDNDHYDVQARVAPEDMAEWQKLSPLGQRVALQSFVIEYLKLKFHQDMTPHPYYALVVGKNGLKMQEYKPGDSFKAADGQTVTAKGQLTWTSNNDIAGLDCTMERLADQLSGHADKGVLDETHLTAGYTFLLHFDPMPDSNRPDSPGIPMLALQPVDATLSMRSAVKQLGLELVSTKGPMDGMVVDHIERPPEN
jgi:uncharacterized protein (TIGR03435 family)